MKRLSGLEGLRALPDGAVVSIGNFDGFHLGHAQILSAMKALRSDDRTPLALVTFEPHPLTVLRPQAVPPRLTSAELKRELLECAGVTHLVELPPSHDVLDLSAEAFWEILRDGTRPSHLVEGDTFNFGKGRSGTIERLREWSADSNITLRQVGSVSTALLDLTVAPISSSMIRWLLQHGRARDASIALGRAYVLRGRVIKGFQRGRTIGVPTANLDVRDQLVPADGVYAGRVKIDETTYPAAVSIGIMPTFDGGERQIEAHVIGYAGDLYDQILDVGLIDWLRDQRKFAGVQSLKRQLARDIEEAAARITYITPGKPTAQLKPTGLLT